MAFRPTARGKVPPVASVPREELGARRPGGCGGTEVTPLPWARLPPKAALSQRPSGDRKGLWRVPARGSGAPQRAHHSKILRFSIAVKQTKEHRSPTVLQLPPKSLATVRDIFFVSFLIK